MWPLSVQRVGAQAPAGAARAGASIQDEIDGRRVLEEGDVLLRVTRGQQRPLDLAAGDVPRVDDAPGRVAALARQIELARGAPVELRAERDEFPDALGALSHRHLHRVRVAEAGAGHQGVLDVGLEGVRGRQHAGDAALGVLGVALVALTLGEHGDGAVPGCLKGEREAGHAATQDKEIEALGHGEQP